MAEGEIEERCDILINDIEKIKAALNAGRIRPEKAAEVMDVLEREVKKIAGTAKDLKKEEEKKL